MTFGQKLKQLRTSKFLTQKDLAEKLNVSFQTISKWESGINEPDLATLKEIANILECSFEELLGCVGADDDVEPEAEAVPDPEPVAVAPTVIIQKEAHVCKRCQKDIDDGDFVMKEEERRVGRTSNFVPVYYHKECFEQTQKEIAEAEAAKKKADKKKGRIICYAWSSVGAVVGFIIGLVACLSPLGVGPAIGVAFGAAFALFAGVYCVLCGSYVSDVFVNISTWSMRFPGVLFSLSPDGILWLITVKIFFWIAGVVLGLIADLIAIVLSAALSIFSLPFAIPWAERNNYEDCLFV